MSKPLYIFLKWIFCVVFLLSNVFITTLSAQNTILPAVQKLAEKAFAQKTITAVREIFEVNISTLRESKEQCQAFMLLAEYERQYGNYYESAERYKQAAAIYPEDSIALLLEAVRSLLCAGDSNAARTLIGKITPHIPVNEDESLYRIAAVYQVWILLSEDKSIDAVTLIKSYLQKKAFVDYYPALLFTLWWITNDESAEKWLIQDFPASIEAAAVQGNVAVLPSLFWYLILSPDHFQSLKRTSTELPLHSPLTTEADQKKAVSDQKFDDNRGYNQQIKPLYYQLGFYKTKKYAEALVADLQKKKFIPILKEEKRSSGTVYFVVLVEENAEGNIGFRLKDSGYEVFPIFP